MAAHWRWLAGLGLLVVLGCGGRAQTGVNLEKQAVSLNDAGYQYYRQSRFDLAQEKFSQALKINRFIDRRVGIASNLNNLGVIALEQEEPRQAVAYFREALKVNRELGEPSGLSETLNNLGLAYLALGRVNEARQVYQEALEQAHLLPPGPLLALSLTHLGDVALACKDFDLALNYYHRAYLVNRSPRDQAVNWERTGRLFLEMQAYGRAGYYLQQALAAFRGLQDTNGIADTLKDLTRLALAQGDREAAALNGGLLLEIYQARGQERQAKKLKALLHKNEGK
jgi:tetratricopeptide (TPR) repeat protein